MRKLQIFGGVIIFLGITALGIYFYLEQNVLGVISPLAEDTLKNSEQYRFIFDRTTTANYPPNEYFPKSLQPRLTDIPEINAKAYCVMERGGNELLLGRNLTQELPIASVTKIMTALVALESGDLNREIRISSAAASIGEAVMGLTAGETLTIEELLYGLLLPSGNDAAEALAEGVGEGRTSFIISMNDKARSLGLFDTYFFNPTGLDGQTRETTSFSTCLDLLALTNYALKNATFADMVSTHNKEIPYKEGKHKAFYLYNILELDRSYPGIKGVKPGITNFASETLVSYAENGGQKMIVVLLGTRNSRDEVVKLYDLIFEQLGTKINK